MRTTLIIVYILFCLALLFDIIRVGTVYISKCNNAIKKAEETDDEELSKTYLQSAHRFHRVVIRTKWAFYISIFLAIGLFFIIF